MSRQRTARVANAASRPRPVGGLEHQRAVCFFESLSDRHCKLREDRYGPDRRADGDPLVGAHQVGHIRDDPLHVEASEILTPPCEASTTEASSPYR